MMTRRFYNLTTLFVAGLLGSALFVTSDHVQRQEKALSALQEKVRYERDALRVLGAEWTYLNRPDRLEQLSATYLQLNAPQSKQIIQTAQRLPDMPDETPSSGILPAAYAPQKEKATQPTHKATPNKPMPVKTLTFDQLMDRLATPTSGH